MRPETRAEARARYEQYLKDQWQSERRQKCGDFTIIFK